MSFYDADGFDEHDYPAPSGGLVALDVYDVVIEDDELTGLDRMAAERYQDELDDIAWCNRNGWPAGA